MSALSRRLKNPKTWLVLFAGLAVLIVVDSFRAPPQQLTARAYVGSVHAYQDVGRPGLKGRVVCRFTPSCSDYSIEAVKRHGIRRGLLLTADRLARCNPQTPLNTYDPVPATEETAGW